MTGIGWRAAAAGFLLAFHLSVASAQTAVSPTPPLLAAATDRARAQAIASQANAEGSKGLYDQAIADFTAAIALDPDAANFLGRGLSYEHRGHYDQAIADLSKAIALQPEMTEAYQSRGVAYDQKGLYDRAIADYTRALVLHAGDAQTYFNRGAAYEHRGLFAKAAADYRASLKLEPTLQAALDGLKRLGDAR